MREHMPSDARVDYALLDAPNVVRANATVRYLIRARNLPELTRLIERVPAKRRQGSAQASH
jgi:aminobenzoyl-glutamate utilization protein B